MVLCEGAEPGVHVWATSPTTAHLYLVSLARPKVALLRHLEHGRREFRHLNQHTQWKA